MTKKTVGVIGVGSIGGRHARNLIKLGHEVVTFDPGRWQNKLADDVWRADAIIIASPTDTHFDYLCGALNRGKAVFVEKPIADRLFEFADKLKPCMVGYNLRFHSCVIAAKGWIEAGHLGAPLWANFVCAEKSQSKDHVILNWSHEIDLALYLLGHGTVVAAAARGDGKLADLTLLHDFGQSTIHLDYLTEPELRQTIVVGEKAKIVLDLVNRQAWLVNNKGVMLDHHVGTDSFDQNYIDEMDTFIARCDGTETIGCTASEALEVLKICLTAQNLSRSTLETSAGSFATSSVAKKNGNSLIITGTG